MKYEHEIITRQKYSFKIINYFQSRKGDDSWLRCNIKQYEASPLIKVNETNLDFGRQQTGDGSSHNKDGSSQETGGARRREQPRDRRGAGGMVAFTHIVDLKRYSLLRCESNYLMSEFSFDITLNRYTLRSTMI